MHQQPFRIFHLEDDDNDATLVERAVRRLDRAVEITRFRDGAEARSYFEQVISPELQLPDLILTDLKMPRMDGCEFVRWLRGSRFSCLPAVILTGSALSNDVLQSYRCGANSFATKPVNAHELNDLIGVVVKYWRDLMHVPTRVGPLHAQHGPCG